MTNDDYKQLQRKLKKLYAQDDFQGAYNLARQFCDQFPEHKQELYYWMISMAAQLGNKEQALDALQKMVDDGQWYGEALLHHNPSFQNLYDDPRFQNLVEKNQILQEIEYDQIHHLITIREKGNCLDVENPCPVLIGLHPNASNAQQAVTKWQKAAKLGFLVAIPQSSQAMWKGAYVWNNLEISSWEIQHYLETLKSQYKVDSQRTILAGEAMGGELAIWLSITRRLISRGFIAVNPTGPFTDEPSSWIPLIRNNSGTNLRGYLILEKGKSLTPPGTIQQFVEILNDENIPCELEVIPDDDFEAYEESFSRAIQYIDTPVYY